MTPTTSRSNTALAATSAPATHHAATASGRDHSAFLSARTTPAAAAHRATGHQPMKTIKSVPVGAEGGVAPIEVGMVTVRPSFAPAPV